MAHFETRSEVNKDRSIPRMGEDTNEDIGGVMDWQNVGEETASDDTRPGPGPIARRLDGPFERKTGHDMVVSHPPMNAKSTGGVVGKPVYGSSPDGYSKNVSLNHDGGLNAGTSGVNLSAKFKNPQVKQDIDPVQRQYND